MVDFNPRIPAVQTAQTLLGLGAASPFTDGTRIPFEFTSTLRRLNAAERNVDTQTDMSDDVAATLQQFTSPYLQEVIECRVNPRSVAFEQPKRYSRKDVRNGSVFFHFNNDRGQDNDILTLRLQGTSGNLDVQSVLNPLPASQSTAALSKLQVFHNLYLMTREPRLIGLNLVNEFRITMRTKVFSSGITFIGFFTKVMSFTEVAEKPNSVDWELEFIVQRTEPDLDSVLNDTLQILEEQTEPSPSVSSGLFGTDG